jgi:hypothetical protein
VPKSKAISLRICKPEDGILQVNVRVARIFPGHSRYGFPLQRNVLPTATIKIIDYYADSLTAEVEIRLLAFNIFPSYLHIQICSGGHSTFDQIRLAMIYSQAIATAAGRGGPEACRSPPPTSSIENAYRFALTPPYACLGL